MKIIELLKAIIAILEILIKMGVLKDDKVGEVAKAAIESALKDA